ncbi:MAG: hypothetical protein AABY07_10670 [Nanoarchaeota archaeon]
MKTKFIILGVLALLLIGIAIAASELSETEEIFLSNVPGDVREQVTKIMNSMTAEQALQLRIQQIASEYNKNNEAKEISEESAE